MNAQNWANIFWANLTVSSTPTQADLDAWTLAFANAYKARFAPLQPAVVNYSLARAVYFAAGGAAITSLVAMSGSGTGGGTVVPDNSATYVLSWLSSVYWRGGKPRTYLPGVNTAAVANATTITNTWITSTSAAAANFRADVNALVSGAITGTQLGFVSFRSGNADRIPAVFYPISGVRTHARLGTQRRRLGRWVA